MIDSKSIAWIGGLVIVVCSFAFVRVLQLKIQGWNRESKPPLPLEGFSSISSYVGSLAGLTIMFTGILETLTFSPVNSLIASWILALMTGLPMWSVVQGLLMEVQAGNIKEIVPGKY